MIDARKDDTPREPAGDEVELEVRTGGASRRVPLRPGLTVGRGEGCDVRLEADFLARPMHGRIERAGGGWRLVAESGAAPESDVGPPVLLKTSDRCRVGSSELRFVPAGRRAEERLAGPPPPSSPPLPNKRFVPREVPSGSGLSAAVTPTFSPAADRSVSADPRPTAAAGDASFPIPPASQRAVAVAGWAAAVVVGIVLPLWCLLDGWPCFFAFAAAAAGPAATLARSGGNLPALARETAAGWWPSVCYAGAAGGGMVAVLALTATSNDNSRGQQPALLLAPLLVSTGVAVQYYCQMALRTAFLIGAGGQFTSARRAEAVACGFQLLTGLGGILLAAILSKA